MTTETNTAPEKCPGCGAKQDRTIAVWVDEGISVTYYVCGSSRWNSLGQWVDTCLASFEWAAAHRASHAALVEAVDLAIGALDMPAHERTVNSVPAAVKILRAALAAGGTTDAGRGLQPAAGEL